MYEPRTLPLLSRARYLRRQALHVAAALGSLLVSLLAGMMGYHYYEGLGWMDAFVNAAMLLGGEGPLEQPHTPGGKLFAGAYALYSGVLFIGLAGLILAPAAHRLIHRFHLEDAGDE